MLSLEFYVGTSIFGYLPCSAFFKKNLFRVGCPVFVAVRGLSLVAGSGGYFAAAVRGFSLGWLLLFQSSGSRVQAQWLEHMSLAVAARGLSCQQVESSQSRDGTHVPSIDGDS